MKPDGKKETWNETFRDVSAADYYAGPLNPDVEAIIGRIPPGGRVLDLGCGMSRTAVLLAERGFRVTAVDFSEVAVGLLKAECARRSLDMDIRLQDVKDFRFEAEYDLIIAYGIFQFLSRADWEKMLAEIKIHTRKGGVNLVLVFSDAVPTPADMEDFMGDAFREGELFDLYSEWAVIKKESYVKEDEHPGGIKHRHPMNMIIAARD